MCDVLGVGLHNGVGLGKLESVFHRPLEQVGEQKGVDAGVAVVGADADQQHFQGVVVFPVHRLGEGEPAEGQQTAARFLEGLGQRGHHDAEGNQFAFLVFDAGNVFQRQQAEIEVHILLDHLVGEDGEVVQVFVALVDEVENLVAVLFFLQHLLGQRTDVAFAAFLDDAGHADDLLGEPFGGVHAVFDPIVVLFKTHSFDVFDIVGVVVDEGHRTHPVVALDEQALGVEIGEAQGADDGVHPVLAAEFHHLVHQGLRDLLVVDEIVPAETDLLVVPLLVGAEVDDGRDTSDGLSVPQGEVHPCVAKFVGGIALAAQGVLHVIFQRGNVVGVIFVEFLGEADELLHVPCRDDFFDFYCHSFFKNVYSCKYTLFPSNRQ